MQEDLCISTQFCTTGKFSFEKLAFDLFLTALKLLNQELTFIFFQHPTLCLNPLLLQELVDELYNFRDCYFETHSVDEAGRKQSDVAQEIEKTLKKLEETEGECTYTAALRPLICGMSFTPAVCLRSRFPTDHFKHKAEFLLQKGRCLNVAPDFSGEAEECLSRAVKLEPGLVEGWNTLGEQYWKKGDLIGAKNCFTGALQQVQLGQEERGICFQLTEAFFSMAFHIKSQNSSATFLDM